MEKSVYIHIPFCETICSYCDFCKFYYQKNWVQSYLKELELEVKQYYQHEIINTIYIGGGTPSILNIQELKQLFSIINVFSLSKNVEFTFECNIESITEEKAIFLKQHGVNRLSIGVETFHEKYLSFLNRHHKVEEVIEKIRMLKKNGFENINVDLIYGLSKETIEEVKEDLELFLSLDIPHISTYSLMIEPNTILGISNVEEIDEEVDYQMYQTIKHTLKTHGFIHYEISNFGKPKYASKHNLVYWNNLEYYGFGIGASGYVNHIRYDNTRNIQEYLKGNYRKVFHKLSLNEEIENELILGFRQLQGISLKKFQKKYQKDCREYDIIKRLLKEGNLIESDGFIKIREEDIYISNRVLCQLIGEKYE